MQDFKFDYFYGSQAEQFSFFRLPKILIRDARFKKISSDAKILYGIMLDRMSLSRENKWMDQNNRVYIIFTLKEVKYSSVYIHKEGHDMYGWDITGASMGVY